MRNVLKCDICGAMGNQPMHENTNKLWAPPGWMVLSHDTDTIDICQECGKKIAIFINDMAKGKGNSSFDQTQLQTLLGYPSEVSPF
jgi:hypothetical protein